MTESRGIKVYVASSWRNPHQPEVVKWIREYGIEVYDFRHPTPETRGFAWSEIDQHYQMWGPAEFRAVFSHPIAKRGFASDLAGMMSSQVCVLVLPCGRSAHLEAGFMAASGKPTYIYMPQKEEPELMYMLTSGVLVSKEELLMTLRRQETAFLAGWRPARMRHLEERSAWPGA